MKRSFVIMGDSANFVHYEILAFVKEHEYYFLGNGRKTVTDAGIPMHAKGKKQFGTYVNGKGDKLRIEYKPDRLRIQMVEGNNEGIMQCLERILC